jgi:hypothetical protein
MNMLKNNNKRDDFRLVGVSLPSPISDFMTLYSAAYGTSKSAIFRYLLENWVSEKRQTESDNTLLQRIVVRVNKQWKVYKKSSGTKSMVVFKRQLTEELSKKGLSEDQINFILTKIKL